MASEPLPPARMVITALRSDSTDKDGVYGVIALGAADVAISLAVTREVISRPAQFVVLPIATPGLLGAIELRGTVIPVFDLRARLGLSEAHGEHDAIVIVADGGRVLGILADQLRGVCRVGAQDLMPLTTGGADLLVSHTFRHPETAAVTSVLDIAQVLALPDVFSTTERGSAAESGDAGESEQFTTMTLLQCGEHMMALDVADAHTTLPDSQARASILTNPPCQGVMRFRDLDIAVLDPLVLLGLGQLDSDQRGPGVVLEIEGHFVVLAVTKLISLERISHASILPIPEVALNRPDLVSGLVRTELAGDALVLDSAAIRRDREVVALASVNVAGEAGRASADEAIAFRGPAQLTYSVGVPVATALEQISEILPHPSELVFTSGPEYLCGILSHRDRTVPVIRLATFLGRAAGPVTPASCVLLVGSGRGQIGFLIDSLIGIDPLTWRDDRAAARTAFDPSRALGSSPLIRVGEADKLIPNLDLLALTSALVGGPEELDSPELTAAWPAA